MRKLGVRSVADLVRLAQHAGVEPHSEWAHDKPAWPENGIEPQTSHGNGMKPALESRQERVL
ncbi:MAG: hypothetical protein AB7O43_05335 [Hyphomicrobiaceae bacterium]